MDDQIYLDEPYLSIRWRSVPQILYAEWKGDGLRRRRSAMGQRSLAASSREGGVETGWPW